MTPFFNPKHLNVPTRATSSGSVHRSVFGLGDIELLDVLIQDGCHSLVREVVGKVSALVGGGLAPVRFASHAYGVTASNRTLNKSKVTKKYLQISLK